MEADLRSVYVGNVSSLYYLWLHNDVLSEPCNVFLLLLYFVVFRPGMKHDFFRTILAFFLAARSGGDVFCLSNM